MAKPRKKKESAWMASEGTRSFPALKKDTQTDVCIIGAGIAGMTCAYLLSREHRSVVVLSDGPVGGGETARTTAHLSNAVDDGYCEMERRHGEEGARVIAQSHTAAIDTIESIIEETDGEEAIECDFERVDGYLFLPKNPTKKSPRAFPKTLEIKFEAAVRAGVPHLEKVDRAPLDFDTGPAIRFGRQAQFHPLKYLHGLTDRILNARGKIYSGTHVVQVEGGETVRVVTEDGWTVTAGAAIVATNTPVNDWVVIHTKQAAYRTYAIGARIPRGSVTRALYWDEPGNGEPYHYVRVSGFPPSDGEAVSNTKLYEMLIVGGEDHKSGQADDAERRYERLEEWARARFPMIQSVDFQWSGQVMEPADGVAFIGRNPMDKPNVYIATGDSGMGMTHGTIAGLLLTDLICGRKNPWERLYDPSRKPLHAVWNFAKENSNVIVQYADWFTGGQVSSPDQIVPGQGAILRQGLKKLAVYRDEAGDLHSRSAVCPHLEGIVAWNSSEKSWDCPCHGSRFDAYGRVIHGPAISDLESAGLDGTQSRAPEKEEGTMKKNAFKKVVWGVALLAASGTAIGSGAWAEGYKNKDDEAKAAQYPADNTGKNVRDRNDATLTPEDQAENEGDRTLVQQVRKALMDDKSLSITAKNVKLIAVNGKITLRGPVNSPGEKDSIANKARQIAGSENVTDQLEVKK